MLVPLERPSRDIDFALSEEEQNENRIVSELDSKLFNEMIDKHKFALKELSDAVYMLEAMRKNDLWKKNWDKVKSGCSMVNFHLDRADAVINTYKKFKWYDKVLQYLKQVGK